MEGLSDGKCRSNRCIGAYEDTHLSLHLPTEYIFGIDKFYGYLTQLCFGDILFVILQELAGRSENLQTEAWQRGGGSDV